MPDFLTVMYDVLATSATPRASRLFLVKASSKLQRQPLWRPAA